MVEYLLRCALQPDQPRPSIETLLHAFIPADARRSHASRRRDRADLDAGRPRARRGGVRRRGRLARLPAARVRHVAADRAAARGEPAPRARFCSRSTASSPGARRARRAYEATIEFVSRAAQAIDAARQRSLRPGRHEGRGARGTGARPPSSAVASRAPRCAARRRRRRRARGRPKPRGGGVRVVRARAGGQPDRRAVPRSPDQHQAQAARRRLRPGSRRRRRARDALSSRASRSTSAWYRGYYEQQPRRRDPAVPDRPGRASSHARPGRRHRHERPDAAERASRATSITARSPSRTPPTRSAASDRSARARRSRSSTGRSSATSSRRRRRAASSRAASRSSPAARAGSAVRRRALLAARGAHVVVADLNYRGRTGSRRRARARSTGVRRALAFRSTSPTRPRWSR